MSKSRIAMRVVGVIVIFIGLLFLLVDYSLRRSFREAFGPEFDNDVRDLGVALKGAAGKALLEHGNIIPSQSGMGTSTNAIDMGKKLVAAYRKDPENYKKYAKVFETCLNAFDVGEEVLKNPLSTGTPITSAEVSSLRPEQRLDAWGHPFCLVTIDSRLAVISGGPEAHAPISCQKIGVGKREILTSKRSLYELPSGELVLILDKNSSKRSDEQALHGP